MLRCHLRNKACHQAGLGRGQKQAAGGWGRAQQEEQQGRGMGIIRQGLVEAASNKQAWTNSSSGSI